MLHPDASQQWFVDAKYVERLNYIVRGHRGIENGLHRVLKATGNEGQGGTGKGIAPRNWRYCGSWR